MTLTNIKNKEQGFTIVELLIVIIVIGILAALVLVGYNNVQAQARDTANVANAGTIEKALETYKSTSDAATYPRVDTSANFTSDVNAMTVNGTATNTIAVPSGVAALLTSDTALPSGTSAANKKAIRVQFCGSATPLTNANATGARVLYYKEVGGTVVNTVVTGTGC